MSEDTDILRKPKLPIMSELKIVLYSKYDCPQCGNEILKNEKYCISCGYKAEEYKELNFIQRIKQTSMITKIILIFGLVFCIAGLAGSLFYISLAIGCVRGAG